MNSLAASAAPFVESCRSATDPSIERLAACAKTCKGCDLWKHATQTVFGEGPQNARLMLVGEQPGDHEDLEGRPFVGPAGRLLDECLTEAGIERETIYLTNAVKHFKWVGRGLRRLHAKPSRGEIVACKPWLDEEIDTIDPEVVVCLGATAAQSLLGAKFKLMAERGQVLPFGAGRSVLATIHPSAILRMPDRSAREESRNMLVADLALAVGTQKNPPRQTE